MSSSGCVTKESSFNSSLSGGSQRSAGSLRDEKRIFNCYSGLNPDALMTGPHSS